MKKIVISALIIVMVVIIFVVVFFNFSPSNNSGGTNSFIPSWNDSTLGDIEIDENVISYVLFQLGANELHNPILSSKTPKIEVNVNDKIFNTEIKKGSIITRKGSIEEEDIRISMTRTNVIDIINSTMPIEVIISAIDEGSMGFEQVASSITLFRKGYLSLYTKFTDEEIEVPRLEPKN